VLAAAVLGSLAVIACLVVVMRREPRAFALLAVVALPFRLPISADGRTVNLLLPLYAVVAAGVIAHLLPRILRRPGGYDSGQAPVLLDWLLLASVGLYALQIVYSPDPGKGAENLLFFYIPFGLLYVLLREAPWTRGLLLTCLAAAVTLAVLFAGVGFIEYYRKALFLNPKVVAANEYDNYFRVNSLFFDPSIYGRFLALVMIAVTTVVLWGRENPRLAACGACDQLLAVEYRGTVAWTGDPGSLALGCARHDLCVRCAGGHSGGVCIGGTFKFALRLEGVERLGQQRDKRPRKTDHGRAGTVCRSAARRVRLRLI
jgi:hypothetical protein